MDPISQGVIGAIASQTPQTTSRKLRAVALLGCLAGLAPDLDIFINSPADPLLFLEYHRQFTHSLAFIPIGAAIVAMASHWLARRLLRPSEIYLACLLGYASHGLLDACTSYGTQLFWPFSNYRVAWNNVSIVDPLFTLPLVALAVAAAVARRRSLAVAGMVWAIAYLLFGVAQNQRAEAAGVALAAARGHEPKRLGAKPGFANLLVWKVIYEYQGRYHIDAVRAGVEVTVCPGTSVPVLDVAADLPWLAPDSRQARDVERFRWFSDDYLALHPTVPNRVVDVRYSVVPNQVNPLWSIALDPGAPRRRHVGFVADRTILSEQGDAYWSMLTGTACGG